MTTLTRRTWSRVCGMALWIYGGVGGQSVADGRAWPLPAYEQGRQSRDSTDLPDLTQQTTLSACLTYSALNNPGLEAAFHQWLAALEKIPQVKALPDPRVTYANFIESVETRVGPQEQKFGVAQMFPWFGILDLRGDIAAQQAKAAYERYESMKFNLFRQVKSGYYEYFYLSRAIAITEENMDLMKRIESVAQAKYKAGAPVAGVIKAQVELGKLDERVRSLKDLRQPVASRLNAALGRTHDAPLPWPTNAPAHRADFVDEDLFALLHGQNPELRGLEHDVAREEKAIRLARRAGYPDFMLGVDYIQTGEALNPDMAGSGKDPVVAMLAIDVPLWRGKYRAGVREATRRREAAELARNDRRNLLDAALRMALYRFRDADRKINLYGKTLVPQAEQSLNVTEEAYRAGSVDFLNLIDAERLLLEFQLAHERASVDREIALAEIEMLVGRPLAGMDMETVERGLKTP
ncbi:MAG: TolC family protein [Verrucomicrobia bacterium]|nr:TolC family protein [Verrucomicrobiota bacterium]MDA1085716.1 TolC family protein [Verrucomicrobiota bacterium]